MLEATMSRGVNVWALTLGAALCGGAPSAHAQSPEPVSLPDAPELTTEAAPSAPPEQPPEETAVELRARLGEGVSFTTGDEFGVQLRARIQFQVAITRPSDDALRAGAEDQTRFEFQIRRLRLALAGHALSRDLTFNIQLGMSPRDMESDLLIPVRDAYITWKAHPWIGVRFGQMKVPFGLQRVVSSSALQTVDRSSVVAELNLDRDIGAYLLGDDLFSLGKLLQYRAGVMGGRGRNRFGGLDAVMFVARLQVNPFGDFDVLSEGDFTRSLEPRLSIGGSFAYNMQSNRGRSTHQDVYRFARFDQLHAGADIHLKWYGFSLGSEVMARIADRGSEIERDAAGMPVLDEQGLPIVERSRSAWGYFVQLGYMLPVPVELVARFGEIRPIRIDGEVGLAFTRELGGAISYYFAEHALKLQADYFFYFGEEVLEEQHQVRLQAQLYF